MAVELRLPLEGPNDADAVVVRWLAADRSDVREGDPLVEVETSKVTVTIASPAAGVLAIVEPDGARVPVGAVLARLHRDRADLPAAPERPAPAVPAPDGRPRFSRAAADYVARHRLPESLFAGRRLVTLDDAVAASAATGRVRRSEPLSASKALEVERLSAATSLQARLTIALDAVSLRREAEAAAVPAVRRLAFVVSAAGQALVAFPRLNACYDDGRVRLHDSVNVGVAIDLGDGLKVPVVQGADGLDPDQIEARLHELTARYAERGLTVRDVSDATVTITSLEADDVLAVQPLLVAGQALAIGLGGDRSLPGAPLTLTATFDHRVTSGREVAGFLGYVRERLRTLAEPPIARRTRPVSTP